MAPERKSTCLTCKHIRVLKDAGRCAECNAVWNRKRERERSRTRVQPQYEGEWRNTARKAIDRHVLQYGYVCVLCPRANARTNPLQCDHITPGSLEGGLRVICRSCNASLGAKHGNALRQKPRS